MRSRVAVQAVAAIGIASVLFGAACGVGVDSYDEFRSAVDEGAPCAELFDQRENFDDEATLEKIDGDLEEIGCESPESEGTDQ